MHTKKKGSGLKKIEETKWEKIESTMLEQVNATSLGTKRKIEKNVVSFIYVMQIKALRFNQDSINGLQLLLQNQ